jgi:glycosidase
VLTTRGVPQLYYGDEIAMEGEDEPTTRGDFPGGFPGDKRNAFTAAGRTKEQQDLFEFIRRLTNLHRELDPLKSGSLVNLYVSEQQYAYARTAKSGAVIVAINNDDKAAEIEFDVKRASLRNGASLTDRLGASRAVTMHDGKLKVTLPRRSAAIFVST